MDTLASTHAAVNYDEDPSNYYEDPSIGNAAVNYYEDPSIGNAAIDEEMQDKIFRVILDIIIGDATERSSR